MKICWNWNHKIGIVEYYDHTILSVYQCNGLCVLAQDDDCNNIVVKTFFKDANHLKQCIGLIQNPKGEKLNLFKTAWKTWQLNTYYGESLILAKYLTMAGFSVELHYQKPKT